MRTVALAALLLLAATVAREAGPACGQAPQAGRLPESAGVKPVEIVIVPEYSEGIVFDHDGNAFISHGKLITQIGGLFGEGPPARKTWAQTGAPNGHKVLADGTH